MSRSTLQSLTLVSVINSGIRAAQRCFDTGPEMQALLAEAYQITEKAVLWWKVTGDEQAHQDHVADVLAKWESWLEQQPNKWSILVNLSVSIILLDDLYQITNNREKRAILDMMFGPVIACHDWINDRQNGFDSYDFAYECVSKLYKITGFPGPKRVVEVAA